MTHNATYTYLWKTSSIPNCDDAKEGDEGKEGAQSSEYLARYALLPQVSFLRRPKDLVPLVPSDRR